MEDVKVGDILIATNGTGWASIKGELYEVIEITSRSQRYIGILVFGKRQNRPGKITFVSNMSYFALYNKPMNRNNANEET